MVWRQKGPPTANYQKAADVWKKDVWDFQAISQTLLELRFSVGNEGKDGKILSSQTWPGSPRRPSPRRPRPPEITITVVIRSGKTDPVQFKGLLKQGPFFLLLEIWAFCKQFSPLGYRTFMSLTKANLSFKSPSPKPHVNRTGSAFALPKLIWGQKKHINFFNINFLAPTQNPQFGAPRKKSLCASFPGKERERGT